MLIKTLGLVGQNQALYPQEIASITMLGDDKELRWELKKEGLKIETPKTKPCDNAYAFKIVRQQPF